MPAATPLILVELNEVSFDYVQHYAARGLLPTFARLIEAHGVTRTTSESVYEQIEPWIQWFSAHTGKSYAEHGVFRLGDGPATAHEQIWEHLEKRGFKVGAFSPMNAANRLQRPAFFVPDPWTQTPCSGPALLRGLHAAVGQAVNDNAQARITPASALRLIAGFLAYAHPAHWTAYIADAIRGLRDHASRALFLDRLLADSFMRIWRATRPDFASVFLNGAAHIQHHYLYNSPAYAGANRNPGWYLPGERDPVLDIYRLYDHLLGDMMALQPRPRLVVATGLHQVPVDKPWYYWRLRDHAGLLAAIGLGHASVEPRMSRDFVVRFADAGAAARGAALLASGRDAEGTPLFEVDDRHDGSLFVMLTYPDDIGPGFTALFDGVQVEDFASQVVFVALKNAHHDGTGYLLDTGVAASAREAEVPLTSLWGRVAGAFAG